MTATYAWTKPFGVPAQIVGEFFYGLSERSPEAFISASRNKKAPTHSLFEWDDSAAATQYRLVQARVILASLEIEIVNPSSGKASSVRAFIGASARGQYVATLDASSDELTDAEARCLAQMRTFKSRWRGLQMARAVISAIDMVERSTRRRKAA